MPPTLHFTTMDSNDTKKAEFAHSDLADACSRDDYMAGLPEITPSIPSADSAMFKRIMMFSPPDYPLRDVISQRSGAVAAAHRPRSANKAAPNVPVTGSIRL
jgi:hypothetical protein